jgi:hypothetical protein
LVEKKTGSGKDNRRFLRDHKQKDRQRQKRNTGISPLQRQSAPPSVEMTFVFGWVGENKQRLPQLQLQLRWPLGQKQNIN